MARGVRHPLLRVVAIRNWRRHPSPGPEPGAACLSVLVTCRALGQEVLHALRRLTIAGDISDDRAADARTDFAELALVRYPHRPLSDRVWELRHDLTACDATFVALAETLAVPLVTCDARLGSAPGHNAHIELFEQ